MNNMTQQPLVSCIIIFLDAAEFIEEAIESILAQRYPNWELLLVDDGSTDQSTAIAKRYSQQYPSQIRYLEHDGHENRGLSASRNLGMRHAKGEYIGFLDADDIWLPHKLETQVPVLEAHPEAGMAYGSLFFWYSWAGEDGSPEQDQEVSIWNFPDQAEVGWPTYLPLFLQERVVIPSPTCMLLRRDIAVEVGGFEEAFRRGFYDDQVFTVKMSLAAPIILLHGYFEKYRQHKGSITYISENLTGEGDRMRSVYLNWVKGYLSDLGIKSPKLQRVVKRELMLARRPRLQKIYRKGSYLKDYLVNRLSA